MPAILSSARIYTPSTCSDNGGYTDSSLAATQAWNGTSLSNVDGLHKRGAATQEIGYAVAGAVIKYAFIELIKAIGHGIERAVYGNGN